MKRYRCENKRYDLGIFKWIEVSDVTGKVVSSSEPTWVHLEFPSAWQVALCKDGSYEGSGWKIVPVPLFSPKEETV